MSESYRDAEDRARMAARQSVKGFKSGEEYLEAMMEDLAEWIEALLKPSNPSLILNPENAVDEFFPTLERGDYLCKLANEIERRVPLEKPPSKPIPRAIAHPNVNPAIESFFARDNVSAFIEWARILGVRECVIFETDDLVLWKNKKHVILSLLDVARLASKRGLTIKPALIVFEEQIERELKIQNETGAGTTLKLIDNSSTTSSDGIAVEGSVSTSLTSSAGSGIDSFANSDIGDDDLEVDIDVNRSQRRVSAPFKSGIPVPSPQIARKTSVGSGRPALKSQPATRILSPSPVRTQRIDPQAALRAHASFNQAMENERKLAEKNFKSLHQLPTSPTTLATSSTSSIPTSGHRPPLPPTSPPLSSSTPRKPSKNRSGSSTGGIVRNQRPHKSDKAVREAVSQCRCSSRFHVSRVSEGRYRVGHQQMTIFVRILRCHVMVRVGGGWDSLESFLDRHDPCRLRSGSSAGNTSFSPPCSGGNSLINDSGLETSGTSDEIDTSSTKIRNFADLTTAHVGAGSEGQLTLNDGGNAITIDKDQQGNYQLTTSKPFHRPGPVETTMKVNTTKRYLLGGTDRRRASQPFTSNSFSTSPFLSSRIPVVQSSSSSSNSSKIPSSLTTRRKTLGANSPSPSLLASTTSSVSKLDATEDNFEKLEQLLLLADEGK